MSEAIEERPEIISPDTERFEYRAAFNKSLAQFRQQVKAPKKNGHVDTGKYGYDYVLLDDLIKSIDDGIKDTGLSWRQEVEVNQGTIRVRTIISHSNGYDYDSPWITLSSGAKPQDIGSAITYAKRYSLGTTFGISSESDDDGEAAQQAKQQKQQSNQGRQQNNNRGQQNNKRAPQGQKNQRRGNQQSPQQNQRPVNTNPSKLNSIAVLLQSIADVKDSNVEEMTLTYEESMHGLNFEHLTEKQADDVISLLTGQANKVKAEAAKQVNNVDTDDLNKQLGEMSDANIRGSEQPTGAK